MNIHLFYYVSNFIYHFVGSTKYRRVVIDEYVAECPEVEKNLWGVQFWSDGYFVSSAGKHNNENIIQEYVKNQGKQDGYEQ